ncbi:hypothetical protein [Candidatus Chlorohelix sp.]|uniref:hypothetical protein n=1 Tax=Candidatus Chlorohelix sp. TaxID=3139201 RepID=UPI00302ECA85
MATRAIKNKGTVALLSAFAGLAWAGVIGFGVIYNVGAYGFWFPGRLLVYVLLLAAPALTFMPIGRMLSASWYGWLAITGWFIFGFMLLFTPPNPTQRWQENLPSMVLFLLGLLLVIYSISWPAFYLLGFRLYKTRVARYNMLRPHREAAFLSIYVISIFTMGALRLLNSTFIFALFLIFLAIELLILSRGKQNS